MHHWVHHSYWPTAIEAASQAGSLDDSLCYSASEPGKSSKKSSLVRGRLFPARTTARSTIKNEFNGLYRFISGITCLDAKADAMQSLCKWLLIDVDHSVQHRSGLRHPEGGFANPFNIITYITHTHTYIYIYIHTCIIYIYIYVCMYVFNGSQVFQDSLVKLSP